MKKAVIVLILALAVIFSGCPCDEEEEVHYISDSEIFDYINLYIGTGGLGFGTGALFPGALAPFGMVKLSPDTTDNGSHPDATHFGGYFYNDSQIRYFSHTHLSGPGATDYGNIGVIPTNGWSDDKVNDKNRYQNFSHDQEEARPGYYTVTLQTDNIEAELTATEHVGVHRYTFPEGVEPCIVFKTSAGLKAGGTVESYSEVVPGENVVRGWTNYNGSLTGRTGGVHIYFHAEFSEDFTGYGVWADDEAFQGEETASGIDTGAYTTFSQEADKQVSVYIGISFISLDQAEANLNEEVPEQDFDTVLSQTTDKWVQMLGQIEVSGGTYDEKVIFYTALYHSYISPSIFSEAGGQYIGFDKNTHNDSGYTYYSEFSMWDTYRSLHPLLVFLRPAEQRDMVRSLLRMAQQGGYLPKWAIAAGYTNCMVGTSADIVIADTYIKGITDFDAEYALSEMIEVATGPTDSESGYGGRSGIEEYLEKGYLSILTKGGCVSVSQEYCYDDFAIAQLANALGDTSTAEQYYTLSENYKYLWNDEEQGFLPLNDDGTWYGVFDDAPAISSNNGYVEGNSWQYLFFVPYDPQGLISLFDGGVDGFNAKLEMFFGNSTVNNQEVTISDNAMPDAYYWHGNEPDIHAAYLFNYSGESDRTQHWIREIVRTKYPNSPEGIPGNDDLGTMSAWLVFAMLGFYPIAATDVYLIGTPFFEHVVIHLDEGDLRISASGASSANRYISSASLNGKILEAPYFTHSEIVNGGALTFRMSGSPQEW